MRFRLRTLMIVLAVLPPLLARAWFTRGQTVAAAHRATAEDWVCLILFFAVLAGTAVAIRNRTKAVR